MSTRCTHARSAISAVPRRRPARAHVREYLLAHHVRWSPRPATAVVYRQHRSPARRHRGARHHQPSSMNARSTARHPQVRVTQQTAAACPVYRRAVRLRYDVGVVTYRVRDACPRSGAGPLFGFCSVLWRFYPPPPHLPRPR